MNILLIDATQTLRNLGLFLRHSRLDPIGIEYIASIAVMNSHKQKILQLNIDDKDIITTIYQFKPDVVGFSVMTFSFPKAILFAQKIKKYKPSIKIIFGGYHPSASLEIVKDENIDFVIIGEGERTFVELLDSFNSNGDVTKVKGIAYWDDGLRINEPRKRIENLDELPFPLRDKDILKECKIGGLSYPSPSKQKSVCQITYSRGCPYNCVFCSSPQLWGKQVRWRSAKNLVDEIENLQQEFGTNMVFFTDLTFDLNKTKILELCNEINNRRVKINWYAMCRPDHINKDLLIQMKEAGCTKISYGVDLVTAHTLSKIKPRQNINLGKIESALELASNLGFITKAYVMIGFPWEDKESLQAIKKILKTLKIDEIRISFITPFPGTPLYEKFKKEGLLMTEDFSRYTSDEPIVKVRSLSQQELVETRKIIFKEFYYSKEYEMRKRDKLKIFPHLKQSYNEFFEFLHRKELLR